jgi:putative endonuclease
MTASRQRTGRLGEDAAARYLERSGWEVVERNCRTPYGEIDIVARDRGALVFVEVRARSSADFGAPAESLTMRKRQRMASCAHAYLAEHAQPEPDWRVDFIGVWVDGRHVTRLEHYRHALQ